MQVTPSPLDVGHECVEVVVPPSVGSQARLDVTSTYPGVAASRRAGVQPQWRLLVRVLTGMHQLLHDSYPGVQPALYTRTCGEAVPALAAASLCRASTVPLLLQSSATPSESLASESLAAAGGQHCGRAWVVAPWLRALCGVPRMVDAARLFPGTLWAFVASLPWTAVPPVVRSCVTVDGGDVDAAAGGDHAPASVDVSVTGVWRGHVPHAVNRRCVGVACGTFFCLLPSLSPSRVR